MVWTPTSVASRWVRGEAREAAERGILVPVRFDQARLPMDVRAIHTTDLDGWGENADSPQAQEFLRALGRDDRAHAGGEIRKGRRGATAAPERQSARFTICVLPFANMSGDPEQEYFSDGITEDIITDLSKVSALAVISRNSAFMYKDKHVDVPKVARELKVEPRARRQRAQGRRAPAHQRAADRRRRPTTTSGPNATTATPPTSSRSRTRSPRRSSRR